MIEIQRAAHAKAEKPAIARESQPPEERIARGFLASGEDVKKPWTLSGELGPWPDEGESAGNEKKPTR